MAASEIAIALMTGFLLYSMSNHLSTLSRPGGGGKVVAGASEDEARCARRVAAYVKARRSCGDKGQNRA